MNRRISRLLANLLSPRSALVMLFDLAAVAAAWLLAYALRFNLDVPSEYAVAALRALVWVLPIYGFVFLLSGLYRGVWRFASLSDMLRIARAAAVGGAGVALGAYLLKIDLAPPRSVIVLSPVLLVLMMGGARAAYRVWKEEQHRSRNPRTRKPVLLLGAGPAAVALVRELNASSEWELAGLLDDDATSHGLEVMGHKLLGPIEALPALAERLQVRHAIIALPDAPAELRQRAASLCLRAGIRALTVPAMADLINGRVTLAAVRRVELEDLLGREPVWIEIDHVRMLLRGETVLVTGAGGSIGSELCRQIARFAPRRIVFFEQSEFALYRLQEEFSTAFRDVETLPLVGDVKDARRLSQVLAQAQPTLVFHAAAYKHVPLMEDHNAWQAIVNNVYGTYVLANECGKAGVRRFVMVSSDKAVNPANVMGASKRMAEMVCQALQTYTNTAMMVVRFGNVLGSAGSVIPKFEEQIARGGPLTVTHPEVTRYFMSIPEAAQLVLQAAAMGQHGQIYVLEMGRQIRIAELARDMIRLSGLSDDQIRIEYTGLRPGEKLYEETINTDELLLPTPHPKLRVAQACVAHGELIPELIRLAENGPALTDEQSRDLLLRWVPGYRPAVNLAEKVQEHARRSEEVLMAPVQTVLPAA